MNYWTEQCKEEYNKEKYISSAQDGKRAVTNMSEPVSGEEKAVAHLVKFMEGFYIAITATLF